MVLISINGNVLRVNPAGEMSGDLIARDKLVMTVSPVIDCREFRAAIKEAQPTGVVKKGQVCRAMPAISCFRLPRPARPDRRRRVP